MTAATLTADRLRHVLTYDKDTGVFARKLYGQRGRNHPVGSVAGTPHKSGYVQIGIDGRFYLAHRLAWLFMYGVWPSGFIDHINGRRADNRISNLRDASSNVNAQNQRIAMRSNRSSGLLGVSTAGAGKWRSTIFVNGKQMRIGVFDTPDEAHSAYIEAKRKFHEGCTI